MRTAEQWMEDFDPAWEDCGGSIEMNVPRIRAIQADALRHALTFCENLETKTPSAYNSVAQVETWLKAEATRIEKGA